MNLPIPEEAPRKGYHELHCAPSSRATHVDQVCGQSGLWRESLRIFGTPSIGGGIHVVLHFKMVSLIQAQLHEDE